MTAITSNSDSGGGKSVLLLLLLLAASAAIGIGLLSALPMTRHAENGRISTTMDADAIRRMIDQRKCRPIEFYVCPPVNQSKAMCYLKSTATDELWAGVLVGINPPNRIITGYVAPYFEYWVGANTRDGCYMVTRIP